MPKSSYDTHVTPSELIRAKSFGSSLSSRILGRAESISGASWTAILVEEGTVHVRTEQKETEFHGPIICWMPWSDKNRMTIMPGAVGAYVNLGSTTLYNAIGYKAESTELRAMSLREFTMGLGRNDNMLDSAKSWFAAILSEHQNQSAASRTIIEAYLRILLIGLWRAYDITGSANRPRSPMQDIYNRFGNLVELHFRDRWSVIKYADALSVSRDRLGDICRGESGKSPKMIVDQRMAIEARLMLEHSTNSIEQISDLLGFATAAHFSRFFNRLVGLPPGKFRGEAGGKQIGMGTQSEGALYEWP